MRGAGRSAESGGLGAEACRQDHGNRNIAITHQLFGRLAIERRALSVRVGGRADAKALLLLEAGHDPFAQFAVVFVDGRDPDARCGCVALVAEDGGEDRKKDQRQQEREHLCDAIALQVGPADLEQGRNHSRNSLPVR
jgi:hypothetical protein